MSAYDYVVLGFYFAYMLAISWFCRRFVRNVSDYFRSGGQVVWWMAGASAFMVSFSAWTFTGAASKAYSNGWPIAMIYVGNTLGFVLGALYFAPRLRQLRVITSMQAVRARFGPGNEQFFTWITLVLRMLYAGIWLYALGVFFSGAFAMPTSATILATGGTVVAIALLGGSWAVVASDFIQVLVLMPVTVVAAVLAISRVGGLSTFVHALRPTHLDLGKLGSEGFLPFWCAAMLIKQVIATNNLGETPRYFCVKDGAHARKAAILAGVLMIVGVFIWFAPPMAAFLVVPDMHAAFPGLKNPSEGSFFAIAQQTFPAGMLGLLVSGVFAATMSAMDAGLNSNAGIFIKNIYQPIFRPDASERQLLVAGKVATGALGLIVIGLALSYSQIEGLSLFQLMINFGILVSLPASMPLLLCMVIRRTPTWSGWSTVVVGSLASYLAWTQLDSRWVSSHFASFASLDPTGRINWDQAASVVIVAGVCTAWFWMSSLFNRFSPVSHSDRIAAFSATIERPIAEGEEAEGAPTTHRQSWLIGWLCLPYGAAIALMALIPNPWSGRAGFLFCSAVLVTIGVALVRQGRVAPGAYAAPMAPATEKTRRGAKLLLCITPQEEAEFLPPPLMEELRDLATSVTIADPSHLDRAQFDLLLRSEDPEILVACWRTPLLPSPTPPGLRYVCYLAGTVRKLVTPEHIGNGVLVTNWGDSVSRVVAEGTLSAILNALRRSGHWITTMHRDGAWKDSKTQTESLFNRRMGIHGFGRVAKELIRILRPFNVTISIFAPESDDELYRIHGVHRSGSLEELFSSNEIVVELSPLIPETRGIVTEDLLRRIPTGGIFINTARGELVDQAALERIAKEGKIHVALDVFASEPLSPDSELRGLPNAVLTPHLAGPTTDRRRDAGRFAVDNIRGYIAGTGLKGVITAEGWHTQSM